MLLRDVARVEAIDAREAKITVARVATFVRIWLGDFRHIVRCETFVTIVTRSEALLVVIHRSQVFLMIVAISTYIRLEQWSFGTIVRIIAARVGQRLGKFLTIVMTIATGVRLRLRDLRNVIRTVATLVGHRLGNLRNIVW